MRITGEYRVQHFDGEVVRAFIPRSLPPTEPPMILNDDLTNLHCAALSAVDRLALAGVLVPNAEWFLYGFVRKEAVISSQIEGTQATLKDVLAYEATKTSKRPDDVREVCNYVDALAYARREIARPRGLPLSSRLLCQARSADGGATAYMLIRHTWRR